MSYFYCHCLQSTSGNGIDELEHFDSDFWDFFVSLYITIKSKNKSALKLHG